MNTYRPYLNYSGAQLVELFEKDIDILNQLIRIKDELQFRKTSKASSLRIKVLARIKELEQNLNNGEKERIYPCSTCNKKLRLPIRTEKQRMICPNCKSFYLFFFDEHGNLILEKEYKETPEEEENPYTTLGISEDASFEEIKRIYKLRMKEYHPDKVENLGRKLRELAETEAKRINQAYDHLMDKFKGNG
jgi:DnaJ-domain-containing protein 1